MHNKRNYKDSANIRLAYQNGLVLKESANWFKQLEQSTGKLRRQTQLIQRYKQAYIIQGALLKLSELASTISDMREFYPAIHNMVSELLHAENFYVVFYDNDSEQYSLQYFSDQKDQHIFDHTPSSAFASGLTGYVARTRSPLLCDTELFKALLASGEIEQQGSLCVHWMGIPLCRNGNVIGVMVIQSYDSSHRYVEADLDLFNSIGGHTVTALDRVRQRELLEETVRKRTQELQDINGSLQKEIRERINAEKLQAALYRISELTASSSDMSSFYSAVHRVLCGLMPAENCYIALLDDKKEKLHFPFYLDAYSPPAKERPLSRGFTEYVIRVGDACLLNQQDVEKLLFSGEIERQKGLHYSTSWLGAPLIINGQAIGVLAVQSYVESYSYSEHELSILRFVSQHIAVAIQRKLTTEQQKKHQEELEKKVFESTRELRQTNLFLRLQVEERKKAEQKLFYEANHDALTGLANRQMFLQQLKQQFALTKRQPQHKLALLFIDLDRFKLINDSQGHHIGDLFLIETSKRLQSSIREHDLAARLGGDEFVVLLNHLQHEQDAEDIAERIIEKIRQPYYLQGQTVYSGASIGIASLQPEYERADALLRDADAAMYQAKSLGRNRFVIFNKTMREQMQQVLTLEQILQQALEDKAFTAVYEPVLCGQAHNLVGYEAHIQWQHPDAGMQYNFSDYAVQAGVLPQIEQLILGRICQTLNDTKPESGLLSMKLSIQHLNTTDLFKKLCAQVKQLKEPQRLCLAFSERDMLSFNDSVQSHLNILRQKGVRLALHDFAADSAPLGLLMQNMFNFVKLNAAFCRSLLRNEQKRHVLHLLQNLALNNKFLLVADGVDDTELLNFMLAEGCCFMQGKYVSDLLSASQLTDSSVTLLQKLA